MRQETCDTLAPLPRYTANDAAPRVADDGSSDDPVTLVLGENYDRYFPITKPPMRFTGRLIGLAEHRRDPSFKSRSRALLWRRVDGGYVAETQVLTVADDDTDGTLYRWHVVDADNPEHLVKRIVETSRNDGLSVLWGAALRQGSDLDDEVAEMWFDIDANSVTYR